MSAREIDGYLEVLEPAKRDALQALRVRILNRIPDADECLSYGMPGFREGKFVLVGFAAFKNHLSWFPHSGQVIPEIVADPATAHLLDGLDWDKGTLRFPVDRVLSEELIDVLIATRRRQTQP